MFVIDLTRSEVTIHCMLERGVSSCSFPWTATFRESGDSIIASVGEKGVKSNEEVAFFHDLRNDFHLIKDRHVQIDIIAQLTREITKTFGKEMVSEDPTTFVVIPYGYSYEIFDVIKEGFLKSESGLKLSSLYNEFVASLIYFLETRDMREKLSPNSDGDTLCFVNSTLSPPMIFLVEYKVMDKECALFVSDYYAYDAQNPKFKPYQKIVRFGQSELAALEGKAVLNLPDGSQVMTGGAMILGSGKFNYMKTYTIDAALGYGIQIDDKSFYPIIPSKLILSKPKMPLTQNKAFTTDMINQSVNLNLYCNFSDSLIGSTKLGTVTLTKDQHNSGNVVVSIELESIHSGKISVFLPRPNANPIVKDFNVPGWLS